MENTDITNISISEESYECSFTVDCAVFGFQEGVLKLLLVQKGIDAFKGYWLLPGGPMQENQTAEQAVENILHLLTGLKNVHQQQVHCYSSVDRHPVKRVVTICFYGIIKPENHPIVSEKHDDVKWFRIDELPKLGFDHDTLANDALNKLKSNVEEKLILGELLPEKFTLTELQELYESLMDQKLDRRNFRRKILQKGLLKKSGEKKTGVKGGPELFELTQR
ncbi:MAG: NUDIX hydrolase [Ekhidna sp.]|nr:NUDIX hydrolase [Ekhidna sp.]